MNKREEYKNIIYGISHKENGDMRSFKNKQKFLQSIKLEQKIIIEARLDHGNQVKIITEKTKNKKPICDGLITTSNQYILSVTVADCLPIFFYNDTNNFVGIIHAGWQGLQKNIIQKMLKIYQQKFNSDLSSIKIIIGPHIQKCHFEVQKDFLKKFKEYKAEHTKDNKHFINLSKIAKDQLIKNGAKAPNIKISNKCTYCSNNKYHSYRKETKDNFKIMLAHISLQ